MPHLPFSSPLLLKIVFFFKFQFSNNFTSSVFIYLLFLFYLFIFILFILIVFKHHLTFSLFFFKYFKISMNNSVIPNNGIYGLDSCKINRVLMGPDIWDFLIDWLILMFDWFASLYDMYAIILYLCTNLVSYDNTQLVIKVRLVLDCVYLFTCYHACFAFTSLIIVRYPQLINQLSRLFHLISIDPF